MSTKNQEDEFYEELDKKTEKHSCCSCKTMVILFAVLLILSIGGVLYCYKAIKQLNLSPKIVNYSSTDKNNFYQKIKIDKENPTFEIVITSEELTAVMSEGVSSKNILIKNIQAIIRQGGIDIFGALIKPLSSQINIVTTPKVKDGKIELEVQKFTAGKLILPKLFNSEFSGALNSLMDQNFSSLYENYKVEQIELLEDQMIIKGKLKGD